jgi:nucleotide-binding universal stress UspA family protein
VIDRQPLGNVLVATDFSAAATSAVERAARLPIDAGSTLTVLHVVAPDHRPEDRATAERALRDAASVAADSAARSGRKDIDVFPRLVEGTPFVEIIRAARHGRNELIVVGRRGEWTLRELLLGSTAERVVRKSDTSVLVVAARPATLDYEKPLVAVDCSATSRRAVELAWRLAHPGLKALEIVHAYWTLPESAIRRVGFSHNDAVECRLEDRRRAQAAVESFAAAELAATPTTLLLEEGDARRVILDVAAHRGADLLAVGTHGRSGLAYVLLGTVAEAVIRRAHCDVLVARAVGLTFALP